MLTPRKFNRGSMRIAIVLWLLAIGVGCAYSFVYEVTPSKTETDHGRFPAGSQFALDLVQSQLSPANPTMGPIRRALS